MTGVVISKLVICIFFVGYQILRHKTIGHKKFAATSTDIDVEIKEGDRFVTVAKIFVLKKIVTTFGLNKLF